jgi:hypothetical protein
MAMTAALRSEALDSMLAHGGGIVDSIAPTR